MKKKAMNNAVKQIIKRVILNSNKSHRLIVQELQDEEFISFCMNFFKKIVDKKLSDKPIDIDWYKQEFLNEELDKNEIANNAGLNMKSITNAYNSSAKNTVIEASLDHYGNLCNIIDRLIKEGESLEIELTIKFKGVSVDLNISESLIVINALSVKRAAIVGGSWSSVGKNAEKPLVTALCKLYDVPQKYYSESGPESMREIDFYIISPDNVPHRTEVKLMGKGNPESADVIHARDTEIFIGDRLSETNKKQFNTNNVQWVALNDKDGYKKFKNILDYYDIPHGEHPADVSNKLDIILDKMFD